MKLSEIGRSFADNRSVHALYHELNNTKSGYPFDQNIVTVFAEQVKNNPSKVAVRDDNGSITYEELDRRSNRLAAFFVNQGFKAESVIAVYLEKSVEMVVQLMGILKAGYTYLPVNTEYPYERIMRILTEASVRMVITEKQFIRNINKLQWDCPSLDSFYCIDSDDVCAEEEPRNELMSKEFWEYIGHTAADEVSGGGWVNSYTGLPFEPAIMNEYGDNALLKLKPFLDKSVKVLEIGCASGITMFRVAPFVHTYVGTDLSQVIIDRNKAICDEQGIDNIQLYCLEAEDIDQLEQNDFDIVIINSVVQAFSGHNYLRKILRKSIGLLKDKGLLFLGDIMDQDVKQAMIDDLVRYRQANDIHKTKIDFSGELFLSRDFFDDLRYEMPEISKVMHSPKIHTIPCELTRFRFDTMISIDKNAEHAMPLKGNRHKKQFDITCLHSFTEEPCPVTIPPNQLAYIIYTSGSTGVPKGVLIEHKGLLRAVKNINYVDIEAGDVWLQTCNTAFDASCFEIFGALLNGSTLCFVSMEVLTDVEKLERYIDDNNVSIIAMVAPLFHELVSLKAIAFSGVKTLIIGGDALLPRIVKAVKNACPHTSVVNVYGPTENAIASTSFAVDGSYHVIPIGKPVSNTRAYIVNESMHLQPVGMAGELCVGGDGLARGYLNDPVLTREKFIKDPFLPGERIYRTGDRARLNAEGNIEFLGRKDGQVKIRGNRIELFEIENKLLDIPQVQNAVVLAQEKSDNNKVICAYLIVSEPVEIQVIRDMLSRDLPHYMIPSYFIFMDNFPLSANNKIDKKALPSLEDAGYGETINLVPPRNEIENTIAGIWKQVLDNPAMGVLENFFEIGGDSLRLIKVFNKINAVYPGVLHISNLFDSPTIEQQALLIQRAMNKNDAMPETSEYMVMKF